MSRIQRSIAERIDAMAPANARAGMDLGMERVGELALRVVLHPWSATQPRRELVVRALADCKRYDVVVLREGEARRELKGVTPRRLEALLFGEP